MCIRYELLNALVLLIPMVCCAHGIQFSVKSHLNQLMMVLWPNTTEEAEKPTITIKIKNQRQKRAYSYTQRKTKNKWNKTESERTKTIIKTRSKNSFIKMVFNASRARAQLPFVEQVRFLWFHLSSHAFDTFNGVFYFFFLLAIHITIAILISCLVLFLNVDLIFYWGYY